MFTNARQLLQLATQLRAHSLPLLVLAIAACSNSGQSPKDLAAPPACPALHGVYKSGAESLLIFETRSSGRVVYNFHGRVFDSGLSGVTSAVNPSEGLSTVSNTFNCPSPDTVDSEQVLVFTLPAGTQIESEGPEEGANIDAASRDAVARLHDGSRRLLFETTGKLRVRSIYRQTEKGLVRTEVSRTELLAPFAASFPAQTKIQEFERTSDLVSDILPSSRDATADAAKYRKMEELRNRLGLSEISRYSEVTGEQFYAALALLEHLDAREFKGAHLGGGVERVDVLQVHFAAVGYGKVRVTRYTNGATALVVPIDSSPEEISAALAEHP